MKVLNDSLGYPVKTVVSVNGKLWMYCADKSGSYIPAHLTRPMARKIAKALMKWADEKKKGGKK